MINAEGKCSSFGGPDDKNVGAKEGLSLVSNDDLQEWRWRHLFLPYSSYNVDFGLARNLNPHALYCAMVWSRYGLSKSQARNAMVRVVTNAGDFLWFQPADTGPGDGTVIGGVQTRDTGRIIDLSPFGLYRLGLKTDDIVKVEIYS